MIATPNPRTMRCFALLCCTVSITCASVAARAQPAPKEPIAYIGHGAMFDQGGSEITPSLGFFSEAQAWYRNRLIGTLDKAQRAQFTALEIRLTRGMQLDTQSRLWASARLLDWLVDRAKIEDPDRLRGKLNLMTRELRAKLPDNAAADRGSAVEPFKLPPALEQRLRNDTLLKMKPVTAKLLVTATAGPAYRQLCTDHGVPVPPDFGPGTPWVARAVPGNPEGIIERADLFIVRGARAQVLTFQSASPPGMCVALPRFDASNTVIADGVICFGQSDPLEPARAKACFWDNQDPSIPLPVVPTDPAPTFTFQRGAAQSISQFAGGSDLRAGAGGICSDCHAGENPYVIHGTVLSSLDNVVGSLPALPTFASTWYDPIVRTGDTAPWPENPGPMNSPPSCNGCHGSFDARGSAGRFPHLSTALPGYCGSVLRSALGALLPPAVMGGMPNVAPAMPPGAVVGDNACTPNLPSGDPRFIACSADKTAACTSVVGAADPRFIKCTPEIANLLNWCGAAASNDAWNRGDPHLRTANGVDYDFQAAGEFVYLRGANGTQIQTRQTPVATASPVGPNDHTGLTSCVSINTAVAARVGKHRVTFQPNLSGEPDPRGMQLRIDGKLVTLAGAPLALGGGGTIARAAVGNGIDISFPDKTRLIATPGWWPAQSIWYLNVDVYNTLAREGIAGGIGPSNWLPSLSNGTLMGAMPAALSQRFVDLNQTFADSWRVDDGTSLFDYANGTSAKSFVNRDWPPNKPPCTLPNDPRPPAKPMEPRRAQALCSKIVDKVTRRNCEVDVTATGEPGFAKTYMISEQLKKPPKISALVKLGG